MAKNMSLPALPAWHARSFYASLLLLATVLCNAFGYDLWPALQRVGLGNSDAEVVDRIMMLAPLAFGFWAWWERRAPHYRLTLKDDLPGLSRIRAFLARLRARLSRLSPVEIQADLEAEQARMAPDALDPEQNEAAR